MKKTNSNPDDFINSLPETQREAVSTLDKLISKTLPNEKPVMWEGIFYAGTMQRIIGYGTMFFQGRSKGAKPVEWLLVGLAPQKDYITIYISGVEAGQTLTKKYGATLGKKVKAGAGTVSFKKLEDVDLVQLVMLLNKAQALRPEGVLKA